MRVSRFLNGTYVIHSIRLDGASWYSAWFDGDGKIIDAERRHGQRCFNIPKKHAKTWTRLQAIGHRYKHVPKLLDANGV